MIRHSLSSVYVKDGFVKSQNSGFLFMPSKNTMLSIAMRSIEGRDRVAKSPQRLMN